MGTQDSVALEIDGLRDRNEAEELTDNLVEFGIRRDAISIQE